MCVPQNWSLDLAALTIDLYQIFLLRQIWEGLLFLWLVPEASDFLAYSLLLFVEFTWWFRFPWLSGLPVLPIFVVPLVIVLSWFLVLKVISFLPSLLALYFTLFLLLKANYPKFESSEGSSCFSSLSSFFSRYFLLPPSSLYLLSPPLPPRPVPLAYRLGSGKFFLPMRNFGNLISRLVSRFLTTSLSSSKSHPLSF